MKRNRAWIRALLGIMLVTACLAAAIAPALTTVQASVAPVSAPPGDIVISRFRFTGPNGTEDDFVEIFNRSCTATVSLTGWELRRSHSTEYSVTYAFPDGASLAPGQYYLIVGTAYGAPATDPTLTVPINNTDGIGLFADPASTLPVDAVGIGTSVDNYFEGSQITYPGNPPTPPSGDYAFTRRVSSGQYVDTNDNSEDFILEQPSNPHAAGQTGTCGIPTITITGNTGVGGVTLSFTDLTAKTVVSDGSGDYTVTVSANFSGTITPSKSGTTFTPPSRSYGNELANLANQNYTATASTNTPSGFNPPVIINEVAYYGTIASSTTDWIELYNTTDADIDLTNWVLESYDGVPSIDLTGVIAKHSYYLLANGNQSSYATRTPTPAASPACFVFRQSDNVRIDQYFTGDLSTAGETLFLVNPSNITVDTANRNGGTWPAGSLTSTHASMERHGVVPDSDIAWYTYADSTPNFVHDCNGNRVYGTPGYGNWAATVTATPSPVPTKYKTPTSRPPTPFGHVVINEFLARAGYDWNQDGSVDVLDEFVEIKNLGPVDAQLNGWKIDVISPGGASSYPLTTQTLKTGERLVFYGLKTHVSLYDVGGTVRLINNRQIVVDARSYGPVGAPDESTCRLPDGFYWRLGCFPTPGNENSLTGVHPAVPPSIAVQPPPCVMADSVPEPFREAECYPFGADIYNPAYWDGQSGFEQFPVQDVMSKHRAVVQ